MRTKVHVEHVPHSWPVPTQLQGPSCFRTAGLGLEVQLVLRSWQTCKLVFPLPLFLTASEPQHTGSLLALQLSHSGTAFWLSPVSPLALWMCSGLWGWEGQHMEKLQTLPSTGPHHRLCRVLMMFSVLSFFPLPS